MNEILFCVQTLSSQQSAWTVSSSATRTMICGCETRPCSRTGHPHRRAFVVPRTKRTIDTPRWRSLWSGSAPAFESSTFYDTMGMMATLNYIITHCTREATLWCCTGKWQWLRCQSLSTLINTLFNWPRPHQQTHYFSTTDTGHCSLSAAAVSGFTTGHWWMMINWMDLLWKWWRGRRWNMVLGELKWRLEGNGN